MDTVIGNREQFFFFLFVSGLTFVSISFSFEGSPQGNTSCSLVTRGLRSVAAAAAHYVTADGFQAPGKSL